MKKEKVIKEKVIEALETSTFKNNGELDHILFFGKLNEILSSEIEPDNEKPYLFYEGNKYFFGDEYEFSDDGKEWCKLIFNDFYNEIDFKFSSYKHIRKIDHTAKYKKLFLKLKEQAEKDGVNLKELI